MSSFVNHQAYQTFERFRFAENHGAHAVFHSAVTALDKRVGRVHITPVYGIHQLEKFGDIRFGWFPVLGFFGFLIYVIYLRPIQDNKRFYGIVTVCGPGKVQHVFRGPPPGCFSAAVCFYCGFRIIAFYFSGILQCTAGSDDVVFVNLYRYIKISKRCMEFAPDIVKGSPAVIVIFCNLRVPLGHRHIDAFAVVSSCAANLHGNDRIPFHGEGRIAVGFNGLIQIYFHHGFLNFKLQVFAVLLNPVDVLLSGFIFRYSCQS